MTGAIAAMIPAIMAGSIGGGGGPPPASSGVRTSGGSLLLNLLVELVDLSLSCLFSLANGVVNLLLNFFLSRHDHLFSIGTGFS